MSLLGTCRKVETWLSDSAKLAAVSANCPALIVTLVEPTPMIAWNSTRKIEAPSPTSPVGTSHTRARAHVVGRSYSTRTICVVGNGIGAGKAPAGSSTIFVSPQRTSEGMCLCRAISLGSMRPCSAPKLPSASMRCWATCHARSRGGDTRRALGDRRNGRNVRGHAVEGLLYRRRHGGHPIGRRAGDVREVRSRAGRRGLRGRGDIDGLGSHRFQLQALTVHPHHLGVDRVALNENPYGLCHRLSFLRNGSAWGHRVAPLALR